MSTLGKRIKYLREKNDYSQKRVADAIGISNVQLSRYESGDRKPDPETISLLASFFDVSTDYLLGRTDNPSSKPYTSELTAKDERDIAKRLEQIKHEIESTDGLAFDGEPLSEEAQESFLEAMEYIVRTTKKINKKYTPKKYRKEKENEDG